MSRLPVWTDTPISPPIIPPQHPSPSSDSPANPSRLPPHSHSPHPFASHHPSTSSPSLPPRPEHNPTQLRGTTASASSGISSTGRTIDPGCPPSQRRYEPVALTEDSLARLSLGEGSSRHLSPSSPPYAAAATGHQRRTPRRQDGHPTAHAPQSLTNPYAYNPASSLSHMGMSRATSGMTSVMSEEEDVEGGEIVGVDEEARSWLDLGEGGRGRRGRQGKDKGGEGERSGKGKGRGEEEEGMAARLPPEILIHVFKLLPDTKDLLSSLLVSRAWCLCAFSLLWYKPHLPNARSLASLIRVLNTPTRSLPYANAVRRLHLTQLAGTLTDELLLGLASCSKLERLNVTGAKGLSAAALSAVLVGMPGLTSADLTGVESVDDKVVDKLARTCEKLQAVNLTNCSLVGDEGVLSLAKNTRLLRRVKFSGCYRITGRSLIPLIRDCPHILEYDFQDVLPVSNAVIHTIFLHSPHLRELRTQGCLELTEDCIPSLPALDAQNDDELVSFSREVGLKFDTADPERDMAWLRPQALSFEFLRTVDMTGCTNLGDRAVDNLVTNASKLRVLTFTKCSGLTDKSLESIGRLGKHLHHLHLGHCRLITDEGVIALSRVCTRMRYIDLACCDLLTDACVAEIGANMPKLRRIGLVKVVNITDEAVLSLVEKYASLERLHLSYCDNLTVKGIAALLNRLGQIKHLSLTGVSAFKVPELQAFCREPPGSFNEHQRSAFCVFSGHRLDDLREYLNRRYLPHLENDTSEESMHGGSETSTSSLTIPRARGTSLAPSPDLSGLAIGAEARGLFWPAMSVNYGSGGAGGSNAAVGGSSDELPYRRGIHSPASGSARHGASSSGVGGILPGIPGEAFMHPTSGDYIGLGLPAPGPGQGGSDSVESSRMGNQSASQTGGIDGFGGSGERSAHAFFGNLSRMVRFSPPRLVGDVDTGGGSPWQPSHTHTSSSTYSDATASVHRHSAALAANPLGLLYTRSPIGGETVDSSGSGQPGRDVAAAQRSPMDLRERPHGPRAPSSSHTPQPNVHHHHHHQAQASAPLTGSSDNTSPLSGFRPTSATNPLMQQSPTVVLRARHASREDGSPTQAGPGAYHAYRGQRDQVSPSASAMSGVTMAESAEDLGPWVHVTRGREGWEGDGSGDSSVGGGGGAGYRAGATSAERSNGGSGSRGREPAERRRRWLACLGGNAHGQGGREWSSER